MTLVLLWSFLLLDPPPPKVGNWSGFTKNFLSFFHSENQLKIFLATFYWVQSHTCTKIWWSYEVLWWSCSDCSDCSCIPPPPPPSRKLDLICKKKKKKKKNSFFSLRKLTGKKNLVAGKVRLLAPKPTHLVSLFLIFQNQSVAGNVIQHLKKLKSSFKTLPVAPKIYWSLEFFKRDTLSNLVHTKKRQIGKCGRSVGYRVDSLTEV